MQRSWGAESQGVSKAGIGDPRDCGSFIDVLGAVFIARGLGEKRQKDKGGAAVAGAWTFQSP